MTRRGRYPAEIRERVVRMVFEHEAEHASPVGDDHLDRLEVRDDPRDVADAARRAEVHAGVRPGLTSNEAGAATRARAREPRTAPGERDPQSRVGFFAREFDP